MGTPGVPRRGGQAKEVEAAGQATPILTRQLQGPIEGEAKPTTGVGLAVPTQGASEVAKGGEATGRPYAADASPTGRLALPSGVRQEAARKAALALPSVPLNVVGGRPRPSTGGMTAGPSAAAEVLVARVEVELGPVGPVELRPPEPEMAKEAFAKPTGHAGLLRLPVAARLLREGGSQELGIATVAAEGGRVGSRLTPLPAR